MREMIKMLIVLTILATLSGGLLAAITPKSADAALKKLRDAGYSAAVIGEITQTPQFKTQ